ncbi:hypothetical protein LDO51_17975 [Providencia alcalifaciens]|uniref:DUF7079 family protein n=1 Tax=Providencia alcalifaciens TaxID=126385 RepID=UPI001CE1ACF9|nr:hypothetical protein [Providencia alcalifaciens]UBX48995.1 hypothetical protein LDO51_17975 [Providencia alcalifaciens]
MGYKIEDRVLCEALSYAFLDTEIDYDYIASIAKNYSTEHVEYMFFNYVARSCYYNTVAPIPSIVYFFDPDELHENIESIMKRDKTIHGKLWMNIFVCYLRFKFKKEWLQLKSLL